MKMKHWLTLGLSLVILACSIPALAVISYYNTTIPTIGHKEICSGSKSYSTYLYDSAINYVSTGTVSFWCWIDKYQDGSWVYAVEEDKLCEPHLSNEIKYDLDVVNMGDPLRARIKKYVIGGGGLTIGGYVNFY